ncbi:hypothetical protein BN12_1480002 [Nostocoides japonicum T1-X7]|uniref:WXG100 family type VII secretion target n=1 Tax=Nostocoides japonicum T1-X7 TaxID=1194083 RepID=A0A077LVG9_9MICO|nr:hypothetical protein [Tetrasphaera japonica]CCH76797.1 hypothetical protein BN12_1480002 [Tetrasphaera japonica T1-X7]
MDVEEGVRARATRVRTEAEVLRRQARAVEALRDVSWTSGAADRFRAQVVERSEQLALLARRVEELAADLDELAAQLRAAQEG